MENKVTSPLRKPKDSMKKKIIAIMMGGDWSDAGVDHLVLLVDDIDEKRLCIHKARIYAIVDRMIKSLSGIKEKE